MNESYLASLEESLLANPKLGSSINLLIEKGLQSRQSIIPVITDKGTHKTLLENEIVSLYNAENYNVKSSNILAHCAYLFFQKKFKTEEINSFQEIKDFIKLLNNFRENHLNRLGILAVTKQIASYLHIRLNYNSQYQFDHLLEIEAKDDYNIWKHDGVKALQDALPYLIIENERILEFVIHCLRIGANDYGWYENIKKRYKSNSSEAWKLLDIVKKEKDESLKYLIAHLLECISWTDYESAYKDLYKLQKTPQFISASFIGLAMIKFPSEEWVDKTLKLAKTKMDEFPSEVVRLYSKLYQAEKSTEIQKSESIDQLQKLAVTTDLKLKENILFQFYLMKIDEKIMVGILKEFYITGNKEELIYLHDISNILGDFKNENNQFEILGHCIEKFPKENLIQLFSSLISEVRQEDMSVWITKWFNEDDFVFNVRASELVRQGYLVKGVPILSKQLLDRYSIFDVEYIVTKILGLVHRHDHLSTLIFSVLQRTPEDKSVNILIESSFLNHILYNYNSPKDFLKEKVKSGNKLEKKIARRILKESNKKEARLNSLARLKELEGSETRINEYHKQRFKNYDLIKEIHKRSAIAQIAKNIQMRAGKGFFLRKEDGSYSSITNFGTIQHSFEMPRGEFVNPVGQEMNRRFYQMFKRRR